MSNFLEDLLKYLKDTPRDKVLEAWERSAELDSVGPSFQEFLANTHYHHVTSQDPVKETRLSQSKNLSPKYPSGFLLVKSLYLNHAESGF